MSNAGRPTNPLDQLYDIVNDLWGASQPAAAPAGTAPGETGRPAPAGAAPEKPRGFQQAFPPFEHFWRTADETVDWTEALAYSSPQDGITSPALWAFFHEHAEQVLAGNVAAYVEVLQQANPLGDLAPYASAFNVRAESADRLTVSFEGLEQYLNAGDAERRRYLAGISLRCARDLMALLPVCETVVTARRDGEQLLEVTFTRQELQKVRFSVVDPVAFVERCGGVFA